MTMLRLWLKHTWYTCARGGAAMVFALLLTAVSVAVAAIGGGIFHALQQVTAGVEKSIAAVAFLSVDSELDAEDVRLRMKALPGVGNTTLTSPQDALARAQQAMGGGRAMGAAGWEGVRMPWVVEVAYQNQAVVDRQQLVAALSSMRGVDQVVLPTQELDRFDHLLRASTIISLIIALLFAVVIMVVVSNAIRLAMLLRKEELAVQLGLGASPSFVVMPIVLAGAGIGWVGGWLGIATFVAMSTVLSRALVAATGIDHFDVQWRWAVALIAVATIIGAGAAAWSARSVLRLSR
jgi:cell division protein FtsX